MKKLSTQKIRKNLRSDASKNHQNDLSNSSDISIKKISSPGHLLSAKSVYDSSKKGLVRPSVNKSKLKKRNAKKRATFVTLDKKYENESNSKSNPGFNQPLSVSDNNVLNLDSNEESDCNEVNILQTSLMEGNFNLIQKEEQKNLFSLDEEANSLQAIYQTLDTFDFILINSKEALAFIPFQTCFYFKGRLSLTCLSGVAEMLGFRIEQNASKTYHVFSPRGYSLQCIRAVGQSKTTFNASRVSALLKSAGLACEEHFLKEKSTENVLLILRSLNCGMVDYMSRKFPINILKKEECVPPESSYWGNENRKLFSQLCNQLDTSIILRGSIFNARFFLQPDVWAEYAQELIEKFHKIEPVRVMVVGGKGVGKSTLLRFLVNQLIQECGRVLVVDFDPGQPELFPAGCVSASLVLEPLLGPNFTHLQQPLYSYFVGNADIIGCPERYVRSCRQLLNDCKIEFSLSNVPTIINTMGFTSGIGLDVTLDLIRLAQPRQLLQISSRSPRRNFVAMFEYDYVTQHPRGWLTDNAESAEKLPYYEMQAIYSSAELSEKSLEEWGFRPSELRQIGLMSYFSQMSSSSQWSLMETVPYCISWQDLAVCICHESVPPTLTMAALNASLVALCILDNETAASVPYYQATVGQYPKILRELPLMPCVGYGIIRGIDMAKGYIYLVSPEPAERLTQVNCLVMGGIQIPESLLLDAPSSLNQDQESATKMRAPYGTYGPSTSQPACRPYRKYNPVFTLRNIV